MREREREAQILWVLNLFFVWMAGRGYFGLVRL